MAERTIIYAVHGARRYFREAVQSARSVRAQDAGARLVAYVRPEDAKQLNASAFDEVRVRDFAVREEFRIDFQLKLLAIADGLCGPTLFLDTDTRICGSLDTAWSLLKRFDLLACHAPLRRRLRYENYTVPDYVSNVPEAFCELNTGVMFFADQPATHALVAAWQALYDAAPGSGDQYLFMDAVYNSDCRLYVLPPEYNFRFRAPQFAGAEVRVLHGRGEGMEDALKHINQSLLPRVSHCENGPLSIVARKVSPRRMTEGRAKK